jgi:hypothetical protein
VIADAEAAVTVRFLARAGDGPPSPGGWGRDGGNSRRSPAQVMTAPLIAVSPVSNGTRSRVWYSHRVSSTERCLTSETRCRTNHATSDAETLAYGVADQIPCPFRVADTKMVKPEFVRLFWVSPDA